MRNPEQRLEPIERLLRLAHEEVDPDQLELDRAPRRRPWRWDSTRPPEPLVDRLVLLAEIGEHQTPEHVKLWTVRRDP